MKSFVLAILITLTLTASESPKTRTEINVPTPTTSGALALIKLTDDELSWSGIIVGGTPEKDMTKSQIEKMVGPFKTNEEIETPYPTADILYHGYHLHLTFNGVTQDLILWSIEVTIPKQGRDMTLDQIAQEFEKMFSAMNPKKSYGKSDVSYRVNRNYGIVCKMDRIRVFCGGIE